jgi:23S rRNA pseudouridine2457 synthase
MVDGVVTEEAINRLKEGVDIGVKKMNGTYHTLPCKAFILPERPSFPPRSKRVRDERHGPTSWISIAISEGKNHQVRKMAAAIGHAVLRLVRVRIGKIELGDLQPGEWREVEYLDY